MESNEDSKEDSNKEDSSEKSEELEIKSEMEQVPASEEALDIFPERVTNERHGIISMREIPHSDRVMGQEHEDKMVIPKKIPGYILQRVKRQAPVPAAAPALVENSTANAINATPQENNTLFTNVLPFDAKLEKELASAPKGLILIVKEPGQSNLIAGEQVDGNLNPIKLNGSAITGAATPTTSKLVKKT